MEPSEFSLTQKTMEHMSHLMEECDYIIMSHQSWLVWGRFGEICHHSSKGVATLAIGKIIARKQRPDCCMRVLGF